MLLLNISIIIINTFQQTGSKFVSYRIAPNICGRLLSNAGQSNCYTGICYMTNWGQM